MFPVAIADSEGVISFQLILGICHKIRFARQHLAEGADSGGDSLDTVDNHAIVVAEDDVAVLPHDFDNKGLVTQVSHLVQMFYFDMDDSFQPGLGNLRNPAVLQMLSKEHAEVRCSHGAGLVGLSQIVQGER